MYWQKIETILHISSIHQQLCTCSECLISWPDHLLLNHYQCRLPKVSSAQCFKLLQRRLMLIKLMSGYQTTLARARRRINWRISRTKHVWIMHIGRDWHNKGLLHNITLLCFRFSLCIYCQMHSCANVLYWASRL